MSSAGMSPCGFCKIRRFGGTYCLLFHGENNQRTKDTLALASDCSTLVDSYFNMFLVCCFHPEYGGGMFLRNVGSYKNHMATHPRRRRSSQSPP
jgi:hypothetical protein